MKVKALFSLSLSLLISAPLLYTPVFAAGSENEDHPLFSAYPNAKQRKTFVQEFEPFQFPISTITDTAKPYKFTGLDTKGNLSRHFYIIDGVSSLKVYENYAAAAKRLGFTILFSCALEKCGSQTQAWILGEILSVENSVYNYYHNPYYLVAEKQTPKGKIYVAWFVGAHETEVAVQQVISETVPLDINLIKVDAAYLNKSDSLAAAAETADAKELARDHKLFARYPNAKLRKTEHTDTELFSIPAAPNAADKAPLNLTGDLTRHFYIAKDVSSLKVFENYKQAFARAGFTLLSKCELAECGSENDMSKLGAKLSVDDNVYNYYRKPYYMVGKKLSPTGDIYAAIFVGAYETEVAIQQVIMQVKSVETGLIKVDADSLKSQIDTEGKALIYGIYFDTGKSAVKPESKPTLDVIAQLLTKNKELLLYVVGHTDDTGTGAANLELSRQRAAAVVAELTGSYKIAPTRLQAQGVGPFAPAANNTSDAGKQKNRRVELVKRLQ